MLSRDLPKEYTIYAVTVIFSATAVPMAEKPTGFKIRFCACLCYNLEFLNGGCASLFLYYFFFVEHFVVPQ